MSTAGFAREFGRCQLEVVSGQLAVVGYVALWAGSPCGRSPDPGTRRDRRSPDVRETCGRRVRRGQETRAELEHH